MLQTIEAIIDEKGILRILDSVALPKMRRVIVTILNEEQPRKPWSGRRMGKKLPCWNNAMRKDISRIPKQKMR